MSPAFWELPFSIASVLAALSILLVFFDSDRVSAQDTIPAQNPVVEDLRRQVEELRDEVRDLRERGIDYQAREAQSGEYSSTADMRQVSYPRVTSLEFSASNSFLQEQECTEANLPVCSCQCQCYPCLCPLPEAPCIDCPRISTLGSHSNVHIFGALVGDMLFNEARPVSPGAPYYLSPSSPTALDQNTVDVHARSSYLGAAITGPQLGSFQASGLAMVFFYNDNVLADQYGILPSQVWGDLRNEDWRFAAGLQYDVFNPSAPTMLAFSVLCGSGNAGNAWRGQFRVERYVTPNENTQLTIQTALSEPISSVITPDFRLLGEDNGWPNFEGRIALGLGPLEAVGMESKRPFEIGFSGVAGQLRTTPIAANRVVTDVWGAGLDLRWKMTESFGFSGEAYTGKALGTYNGGILQNANLATFQGIRSSGGWGEAFFYWTPCLHSHLGYAIDDPDNDDLSANPADFQRERNETIFANLIWDPNAALRIGFEMTYRETENTSVFDNHGMGYHSQVSWSY